LARKIKPATLRDILISKRGLELLKEARDCFKKANAPRATAAIRKAIKSAEGAVNHAHHRLVRVRCADDATHQEN
jgi:hypothetical protein